MALQRSRFDLTVDDVALLLDDEPSYRVDQVWDALYAQGIDPATATNLSKALRVRLAEHPAFELALRPRHESITPNGDTVKWLWDLHDGRQIETVLMHYRDRSTVCVSSQAGCAMGCGFCATGQAGFDRHLTVGEILEQVVRARTTAASDNRRLSNVVFMGMGEPMANFDAVWEAVGRIHRDLGLSARNITISTVGLVPGIRQLAQQDLPVTLAVSLHAANDTLRDDLVPINRRYPIAEIVSACRAWRRARNRRLSFEWALIDGVNDRGQDVRELAGLAIPLGAHVNLIPLNPTPDYATPGTPPDRVAGFRDALVSAGVNATVRRNRGTDIDAACGQLRATVGAGSVPVAFTRLTD
ncbi:MAG: 23S rRNA (adenine(2503)-C(2))-methyltransferase RlmN [Acidimicrobiales bacterium]